MYSPVRQWKTANPAVVKGFLKACRERNASSRVRLALFEAGIVEANLKNPTSGDRDSVGSLQQRAGWGSINERMNPRHAAGEFIKDAQTRVVPHHPEYKAGQVAQAVQRSAFPDRYKMAYLSARYVIARSIAKGWNK